VALREYRIQFTGSGTDGESWCSKPRVRAMATAAQAASLVDFGETHVTKGLSRMTKGLMNKGEGSYLHFADGRKMLDFTTGIGVTVLGLSLI
jgi:4-aminobutyrate aminotransferase-like enzyme